MLWSWWRRRDFRADSSLDDAALVEADDRARQEEQRLQSVVAGIRERREAAESLARAARAEADLAVRSRGVEHLRAAEASLRAGDHRRAWQDLHRNVTHFLMDDAPPDVALKGPNFWPEIEANAEVLETAKRLEQRIQWHYRLEQAEVAREARDDSATDPIIDFDSLDAHIAQSTPDRGRPRVVGIIYTITLPDGEVYVGKTTRDAQVRWDEHAREAAAGDEKPKSLAIRYWMRQGRAGDIRWRVEESVLGWSDEDLAAAEKRWMRIGTLNVMDATRAATKYPAV